MFDIVLENGNLITMNNNNEILYNKDIFIKDGEIILSNLDWYLFVTLGFALDCI